MRCRPGVTFVDNGNGTGTLSGTPAAGTGGSLRDHLHGGERRPAERHAGLHAERQPGAGDHQRDQHHVHGWHRRIVHRHHERIPGADRDRGGVALPAGITFVDNGNGTGTLSGTPAAGTGGSYAITFTATNTVGSTAPQAFTLTVNQAPAITSANTTSFTVGVAGTFTVTTTAFPAPAITRDRRRAARAG